MPDITITSLFLCLIPCLGVIYLSYLWGGRGREMIYAIARMVVQLLAVGYALIFIFDSERWQIGAAVVALMIIVSSIIAVRMVTRRRGLAFALALVALALAGGGVFLFVDVFVLQVKDPWYQPRILIPIAGMIFSTAMTAITLAAERYQKEIDAGQSYLAARKEGWNAAMIPQVNALFAVGLVSLPGMMTGQILSGVDPLVAVRYQIVVMAMLLQASGYSVAIFLFLAHKTGLFAAPPTTGTLDPR